MATCERVSPKQDPGNFLEKRGLRRLDTPAPECYVSVEGTLQLLHLRVNCALFAESVKRGLGPLRRFAMSLNGLLTGVVLGVAAYVCVQTVPVYLKSYEFEAAARREAQLAAVNFRSNEAVQGEIYDKAHELGLPVEMEQIRVESVVTESNPGTSVASLMGAESPSEPSASAKARLDIEVSYAVPVEFPGWTFRLNFHVQADDRSA
jgi:hypothetical protein